LRRWIDFSVIMQHIFDMVFSMFNTVFEHYILHSCLEYHSSYAIKASDILCLLKFRLDFISKSHSQLEATV